MRDLLKKLWKEQSGMIVSSEIILVGTILVLGSIAGLTSLHYAVNRQLADCAQAVETMGGDPGNTHDITDSEGIVELSGDGVY